MLWNAAETAIRSLMETQWALGAYTNMPLVFENENTIYDDRYMAVSIEGVFAEKAMYGSAGHRLSVEAGIVFFHAFIPTGKGKSTAMGAVAAMTAILEYQVISNAIRLEGGAPPSPVAYGADDRELPNQQPGGNYFRCSGSVPFIVVDSR